jgi:hypothetical protein
MPTRSYPPTTTRSINTCGTSMTDQTILSKNLYVPMTGFSIDADVGDLSDMEPLVYMDDCQLIANVDVHGTNDFNRLTCSAHPELDATGNFGCVECSRC